MQTVHDINHTLDDCTKKQKDEEKRRKKNGIKRADSQKHKEKRCKRMGQEGFKK